MKPSPRRTSPAEAAAGMAEAAAGTAEAAAVDTRADAVAAAAAVAATAATGTNPPVFRYNNSPGESSALPGFFLFRTHGAHRGAHACLRDARRARLEPTQMASTKTSTATAATT